MVCAKYGDTTRLKECSPSDKKCATTVSPTATGLTITPTGCLNLCSKDLPPVVGLSGATLQIWQLDSSSFLSKKLKIRIYRTIIFPVFLYGCETWSLTLREERRLRVFENRVLRRVFGPKRDEVTGNGENYIMKSLSLSSLPNIVRVVKSRRMR